MRITPIGVGEAFDPDQPNSASLVEQDGFTLLIDCGHSVVPLLWRSRPDPESIDAVFLTHHHADHVIGLPSVLDRWSWDGRRKELLVVTTAWGQSQLMQICDLLGIAPQFPIRYARAEETPQLGPFGMRTAPTDHYVPNQAVRLEARGRRFAYSGDGRPTAAALALYADADLLLHECWAADPVAADSYHCDLATVRSIVGPTRIGLYHIRAGGRPAVQDAIVGDHRLFVAAPGQPLDL